LSFPTMSSLEEYFEEIQNSDSEEFYRGEMTRSKNGKPFESVASLQKRLEKIQTRSGYNSEDLSDLEEMTEDEYNLMKAENLLLDDALTYVVDTTLRVCVENRLYKITEYGTFSTEIKNSKNIELAIRDFEPSTSIRVAPGASVELNNDVVFTNSFATTIQENFDLSELETIPTVLATNSVSGENSFHTGYNVETYKWKNNSVFQKFLDKLRGKDVSKTNNFNKKKRVKVNVFDVNYQFYASAGIKVTMEKRKRFLGIPYWVSETASKLVIGFNGMEGEMKYSNPRSFSNILPTPSGAWGKFTGKLNDLQSNFIYGNYHKLPFIKDWVDDIIIMMPEIKIGNQDWVAKIGNKIYDSPPNAVYSLLKSLDNRYIYNPIKKQITPKDPRVGYFVWGNSTVTFNKERPYVVGVQEYSSRKSKSVIFDRSFGLNFYNGAVSGFLPTEFDIKKLDMFGAAYYDGKWLGIRFITE